MNNLYILIALVVILIIVAIVIFYSSKSNAEAENFTEPSYSGPPMPLKEDMEDISCGCGHNVEADEYGCGYETLEEKNISNEQFSNIGDNSLITMKDNGNMYKHKTRVDYL